MLGLMHTVNLKFNQFYGFFMSLLYNYENFTIVTHLISVFKIFLSKKMEKEIN